MSPGSITMKKVLVILALAVPLKAGVLYDAELGTLPGQQRWTYLPDPLNAQATQTAPDGFAATLNTPTASDKAGYFSGLPPFFPNHPGVGTLNRATGITLNFRVRLREESHANTNRAGFSVIVITSDLKGLELGFWSDEIWAQSDSPMFTHGEGVKMGVANKVLRLALRLEGDGYTLTDDSGVILSGPLRNYSSFGAPYSFPNFVFFGDDTTSASARVEISRIALGGDRVFPPTLSLAGSSEGLDLRVEFREPATYTIQSKSSIDSSEWFPVQSIRAGTGSLTISAPIQPGSEFFRAVMSDY